MEKLLIPALLAAMLVTTGAAHAAGTATPAIDQRQENQEHRIEQGEASGALNPKEAAHLEAQQNRIENAEDRAKADGVVTRRERAVLHERQDHASHAIARRKHNDR